MKLATYENELFLRAKGGDKDAQDEFLNNNKGLVYLVVKRFMKRCETDDLIQLGMIGLYKAMMNFNPSFEVKFSTYAVPMISGEIKRFLRDDTPLKISRSTKELALKIKLKTEEYEKEYNISPSVSEIAKLLLVSEEDVIYAMNASMDVVSLSESIGKEDEKMLVIDKIEDNKNESEETIVDKITLKEMLGDLKPRERQIIIFRYFKEMTQENIAKILGISQVQVCRIEKKVLLLLKNKLDENIP